MFNYNNLGFCDYCTFGGLYKGAKMEKLDYLYGQKKMPNTWQPCHVLEIVNYLKEKGYNYELYKETSKSKFILVNKNACLFYKTCAEICNALVDLYFLEKEDPLSVQRIFQLYPGCPSCYPHSNGGMVSAGCSTWAIHAIRPSASSVIVSSAILLMRSGTRSFARVPASNSKINTRR